jgi:branched-chain amino acid aminotransferase
VLQLCEENNIPYQVRDITLAEVYRADEIFCTGTMGELAAVTCVDGRTIGSGVVGEMTLRLSALFDGLTKIEGVAVI